MPENTFQKGERIVCIRGWGTHPVVPGDLGTICGVIPRLHSDDPLALYEIVFDKYKNIATHRCGQGVSGSYIKSYINGLEVAIKYAEEFKRRWHDI